ncbi:unnamed protein product [Phytomonas sp. EM1]|nr:unnamed protein product [Phytomonas sp. EM1]|eukprot:CCW65276.1 unnamed protein product [Phytomonas sp. isolate EM1]
MFQSANRHASPSRISHSALVRVACAAARKYERLLHQENFTRALLCEELCQTSKTWRQASVGARNMLRLHHPQLRRIVLLPSSLWPSFSKDVLDEIQAEEANFADFLRSSEEVGPSTAFQTYKGLQQCVGQQGAEWLLEFARHRAANNTMNAARSQPLLESLQWLLQQLPCAAPHNDRIGCCEDDDKELPYMDDIPPLSSTHDALQQRSVEKSKETQSGKLRFVSSEGPDPEADVKGRFDQVGDLDRQEIVSEPNFSPSLRPLPLPQQDASGDALEKSLFATDDSSCDMEWEQLNQAYLSAQEARERTLRQRLCRLVEVVEDGVGQGTRARDNTVYPPHEDGNGQAAAESSEACRLASGSSEAGDSIDVFSAVREVCVPFLGLRAACVTGAEEAHYCVMCELGGSLSVRDQLNAKNENSDQEGNHSDEEPPLLRCAGCKALVHRMCAHQGGQHTANLLYCSKYCTPSTL